MKATLLSLRCVVCYDRIVYFTVQVHVCVRMCVRHTKNHASTEFGHFCLCRILYYVQSVDPFADLELYMNWEPNAWNDRPWIVAQGEGVFKHVDKKKWGM